MDALTAASPDRRPHRLARPALLAALLAACLTALMAALPGSGALPGAPATADAAPVNCPATFHVLHNDRIGDLRLRAGHYRIRVLDARRLTCKHAANLFTNFLQDFDGNLPGQWRVIASRQLFKRASGVGFSVRQVDGPSGGGGGGSGGEGRHPGHGATKCPTFQVLHNDRINNVRFRRGTYQMTALGGFSCQRSSNKFARFLSLGQTPNHWVLRSRTGTFKRGHTRQGFQVNYWG